MVLDKLKKQGIISFKFFKKFGDEIIGNDKNMKEGALLEAANDLLALVNFKMQKVGHGPVANELMMVRSRVEEVVISLQRIHEYENIPKYVYVIHDNGVIRKLTKTELFMLTEDQMTVKEFLGLK